MGKTEKKRLYNRDWEDLPELKRWLKKSDTVPDMAYCTLCRGNLRIHLNDLKKHPQTLKHKKLDEARKAQKSVVTAFKPTPRLLTQQQKQKRRDLRFALFTSVKSSFRSIDPLGEIIDQEFGPNVIKLHRTKCMALVKNILGPYFKSELQQDLLNAPFSILLDESTDISATKLLAFSIRYYSARFKDIKETFLCIKEIVHADANSLVAVLKEVVQEWRLDPENFVGLSTDGCNVMVGEHHSLMTLARKEFPNLIHMKCVAHSLDLCAKYAMKTMPSNLEYMIKHSYNWFAHSTIRQFNYQEILNVVGFDTLEFDDDEPREIIDPDP